MAKTVATDPSIARRRFTAIAAVLRDNIIILTIYLYFTAFTFRHALFTVFGAPTSAAPSVYDIVYAFEAFRWAPWYCITVLVLLIALIVSLFGGSWPWRFRLPLAGFAAVALFAILYWTGISAAQADVVALQTGGGVPIQIAPHDHRFDAVAAEGRAYRLFLLLDTADELYVLDVPKGDPSIPSPPVASVYRIPKSALDYSQVLVKW